MQLSTEHRESIDNGYEVKIDRHDFLGELKRHRLIEYLTKNYFENKCIAYIDSLHESAKKDLEKWEKSKISENPEETVRNQFLDAKTKLEEVREKVAELANALDIQMPDYALEESKEE